MFNFDADKFSLSGAKGSLAIKPDDDLSIKLIMLVEGQCSDVGPLNAAKKYGYSKQRYYQILNLEFVS